MLAVFHRVYLCQICFLGVYDANLIDYLGFHIKKILIW